MPDRSRTIAQTVLDVPLHKHLKIRLIDENAPQRGIEITVGDEHLNNVGVLHGGIYPSLLDVAAYLAIIPHLAEGTNATTVSANTSIARGGKRGDVIQFIGESTRTGRTLAFTTARAVKDGQTIATCDLVKAIVPWPEPSAPA
jgi:uncharacterized protein (TIGR00369 family)